MTTADQGTNMGDADRLFLQGVTGATSATALLDQYGPGVDAWPTGYKTLEFGREGTEHDPAAAVSIAAAGALAVRAEAGIGGAGGAFNSHARLIGATLQSTVMDAALDSLGVGGGRVVTLSIATNLGDAGASPRLADTLLSKGTLSSILGESVNDVGRDAGTGGSWGEAGTRAGNKLHFVEPDELLTKSSDALRKYLIKFYGVHSISNHPDLINACAYGALARRTGASDKYPSDPSARVWLGALVEACNALQSKLPPDRTLESVLPTACYKQYELAVGLQVPGRPRGRAEPTLTSKDLPVRQRTVAEAIALDFGPGIPLTGSGRRGASGDGGASEFAAMSYSGSRERRLTESVNQKYLDLIRKHLIAYNACREKTAQNQAHFRAERDRIFAGMTQAFNDVPAVRPSNIRRIRESEEALGDLLNADGSSAPLALLPGLLGRYPASDEVVPTWENDIAVTLAAASMRRFDSLNDLRAYQTFLYGARGRTAREHAAVHVLANIGLLLCGGLQDLSESHLAQFGLRPGDVRLYQKLRGLIEPDGASWYHVDALEHPPTHLLQHVADIINFNHDSVMPIGPDVRVRGKEMTDQEYRKAQNGHYTPTRSQRRRQETESLQQQQQRLKREVSHITRAAQSYISRHYNMPVHSSSRLFNVLLECDLAERQGFLSMTPDLQAIIAQRTGRIFAGVNMATLPEAARPIVRRVREIQAEQRAGKSKIRQFFDDIAIDPYNQ